MEYSRDSESKVKRLQLLKEQIKELREKHNDKVTRLWVLEDKKNKTDTKHDNKLLEEIESLGKEIEESQSETTIKQFQSEIEELEIELYGHYNSYSP